VENRAKKSTIRIRGNNSLGIRAKDDAELVSANRANEPLYVLNGIPISSDVFNTINPDDIVEIKVLKDGLSTVEYGTRGANGVIEIVTKRGIVGKTTYKCALSTYCQADFRLGWHPPDEVIRKTGHGA
jgi:TonB-dependent Receptor Plug Domain.